MLSRVIAENIGDVFLRHSTTDSRSQSIQSGSKPWLDLEVRWNKCNSTTIIERDYIIHLILK